MAAALTASRASRRPNWAYWVTLKLEEQGQLHWHPCIQACRHGHTSIYTYTSATAQCSNVIFCLQIGCGGCAFGGAEVCKSKLGRSRLQTFMVFLVHFLVCVCVSVFRSYTAGLGDFACSGLFCFRESVGLLVLSCRGEEFALNFSGYGRGVLL